MLDVDMEPLQVCGPLLMAIIRQFSLCLHKMQRLMISVGDCLLPENVMSPYLILDVDMELLQVCGPLMMAVIMQFSSCLHKLQRLMISVDDCLLPENVMSPLVAGLYNGVHLFVVIGVITNNI
jgi:hypothetical protein